MKTVNEYTAVQGLFSRTAGFNLNMPWENAEYEKIFSGLTIEELDFMYDMRSGDKYLKRLIDSDQKFNLALRMAMKKYRLKWNSLADTFIMEYDPIENYNMVERETVTTTRHSDGNSTTDVNSVSDTNNDNTETLNTNNTTQNSGDETTTNTGTNAVNNTIVGGYKDKIAENYTDTHTITNTGSEKITEKDHQTYKIETKNEKTGQTSEMDHQSYKITTTNEKSGKMTELHDHKHENHQETISFTDRLHTSEHLQSAFNESTTASSADGTTKSTGSNDTIKYSDNSGYDRESKDIVADCGKEVHRFDVPATSSGEYKNEWTDTTTYGTSAEPLKEKTTETRTVDDTTTANAKITKFGTDATPLTETTTEERKITDTSDNNAKTTTTEYENRETTDTIERTRDIDDNYTHHVYDDNYKETSTTTLNTTTKNSDNRKFETTNTGTISNSGTSKTIDKNTSVTNNTSDDNATEIHELTRSGNIGVTSSEQLIESFRELWLYDYWDIVLSDIDYEITLAIWS